MVRYVPCGYRLWNIKEKKIILSRNVIFNEKLLYKQWKLKDDGKVTETKKIVQIEECENNFIQGTQQ